MDGRDARYYDDNTLLQNIGRGVKKTVYLFEFSNQLIIRNCRPRSTKLGLLSKSTVCHV